LDAKHVCSRPKQKGVRKGCAEVEDSRDANPTEH
jgi:hypothetical protein